VRRFASTVPTIPHSGAFVNTESSFSACPDGLIARIAGVVYILLIVSELYYLYYPLEGEYAASPSYVWQFYMLAKFLIRDAHTILIICLPT